MPKVITFSRVFPAYHPRKGEPTYFVEAILNSVMPKKANGIINRNDIPQNVLDIINYFVILDGDTQKHHTIRAGNRWKVGDKFSPRVWSGKPYNSKQIIIAPDIEIVKVWDIEIKVKPKNDLSGFADILINGNKIDAEFLKQVAANDGLTLGDLLRWFQYPKPFKGQIICWNPNVKY